jgi:hypothetical protein
MIGMTPPERHGQIAAAAMAFILCSTVLCAAPAQAGDKGSVEAQRVAAQMRGISMVGQPGLRVTPREERRRAILKELHGLGADGVAALITALKDSDVQMRENAALALIALGGGYESALKPALDIRAAVPALIDATADGDSDVRAWAALAIAEIGPAATPAIPALIKLVSDPEARPRNNSCLALGRIGPSARDALPALRRALNDPSNDVRRFAKAAIERIEK